jgi:drug/metabolite transporter (DMT)-like permease
MLNVVIGYIILAVGGSTLIKYGGLSKVAALFTLPVVNVQISITTLVGILFYGLSFAIYILLLNRFDLSFISPVTIGVVYVLLMLTAVFVFGEQFTILKTIGCALILAGVLLVLTQK